MKQTLTYLATLLIYINSFGQCDADHTILLTNFEFIPSEIIITPGETVAFINLEGLHSVNGINNSVTGETFDNPVEYFIEPNEGTEEGVCMGVIKFENPGQYNFDCSINFNAQAGMNLSINVDAFDLGDLLDSIQDSEDIWMSNYAFKIFTPELLGGEGPWTLFVPNNDAVYEIMEYMNLGQFDALSIPDNIEIMKYHFSEGLWNNDDLYDGLELISAQGETLNISQNEENKFINNAEIISTDFTAYNGIVHIIDYCLAPENLPESTVMEIIASSPNHEYFEEAIINTTIDDELSIQATIDNSIDGPGPFTVFAPTDEAFSFFAEESGMTIDELLNSQFIYSIVKKHIINGCVDDYVINGNSNIMDEYCFQGSYNEILSSDIYGGQDGAVNIEDEYLQFQVNDSTITIIGNESQAEIIIKDLIAYNGVVHVIDAIISPLSNETDLNGSCGTWRIELQGQSQNGWGASQLYIYINGLLIDQISLYEGNNLQSYEFGVNTNDIIDLIYTPFSGSSNNAYRLYDQNNDMIFETFGFGNTGPSSITNINACQTQDKSNCGEITIKLFDEGIETPGWINGYLDVYKNNQLEAQISMLDGYEQFTYIDANENDIFDFEYNSSVYPSENGYEIYNTENELIVDENNTNEIPMSTNNIVICSTSPTNMIEESQNNDHKKIIKQIDILGRITNDNFITIDMYDDGSTDKRISIK